jgi:hypothetical protein
MTLPGFLVIGPPRTGTTWLFRRLEEHPQVFVPAIKQVHFFDRNYGEGIGWYENAFAKAPGTAEAVGELTPDYFALPEGPERIAEALGTDVLLCVIVRDPVERAISEWRVKQRLAASPMSFLEALDSDPMLVSNSSYTAHLRHYRKVFDDVRLKVFRYEQMEDDPAGFLRSFLTAIGVDPTFESQRLNERVSVSQPLARSRSLGRLTRRMGRSLEKLPMGRRVLWALRSLGFVRLAHRANAPSSSQERRDDEYQTAYAAFADDWEQLEPLLREMRGT